MSELLDELTKLLEGVGAYSVQDRDKAIALIRTEYARKQCPNSKGGCFHCNTEIDYLALTGQLCRAHLSASYDWVESMKQSWQHPPQVWEENNKQIVQGYEWKNIRQYLCAECQTMVQGISRSLLGLSFGRSEEMAIELESVYKLGWTPGRWVQIVRKLQGKSRLDGVCPIHTSEMQSILSTASSALFSAYYARMDYSAFLASPYWLMIRDVIFSVRGRACECCSSTEGLRVHHKSYEYRGKEASHLEDLQVLCDACHAKEHGKPVASASSTKSAAISAAKSRKMRQL